MKIQTAQPPAFYEQRFVNGNSTIVVIGGLDTTSYSEQNQAEEWWRARHPEEYIFNCRHQAHTSRVCDVYRKVP